MKLTPLDIHHKEFRRAIRGYSEEEVDVFLDQVADEFERVFKDNIELKEQVQGMQEKVKQYEGVEHTLQKALLTAQQAADDVQNNALKESELIIKDAELKAKEIIQQVLTEKQNLQNELSELKIGEKEFRDKFKHLLTQYLEVISQVEKGERPAAVEMPIVSEAPDISEPAEEGQEPELPSVSETEVPTEKTETPAEPDDFAAWSRPEPVEPEPKIEFDAVAPDIGAGGSSFFADKKDDAGGFEETAFASPAYDHPTADKSAETDFSVSFGASDRSDGQTSYDPTTESIESSAEAPTVVTEAPTESGETEVPVFDPFGRSTPRESAETAPPVSSFFDDDLGVDEEEKKDVQPGAPGDGSGEPA